MTQVLGVIDRYSQGRGIFVAKSYVLKALRIFGLEEILKISRTVQVKPSQMKKAAGEELIVWDDASEDVTHAEHHHSEENVLPFKKTFKPNEMEESLKDPNDKGVAAEESLSSFLSSDFLLWQRELTKDNTTTPKKDAVKGYSRSTEMYVVKTPTNEGADKIRFASTNGVLVNKKQA